MLVFNPNALRHTKVPQREGFTLIEIMVSVLIISTVIMALLQLFSNNSRFFLSMDSKASLSMQSTLLIGATNYGFEKKNVTLYDLIDGFEVDNEVRQALKSQKIELNYIEVMRLDGDDMADNAEELVTDDTIVTEKSSGGASLEIGRSILSTTDQRNSFLRIKLQ